MSWAVEPGSRLAGGVAVVDAVFARHAAHWAAIRLGVLRVDDSEPLRIGWIEPIGNFGHDAGVRIEPPDSLASPFEADTEVDAGAGEVDHEIWLRVGHGNHAYVSTSAGVDDMNARRGRGTGGPA